MRGRVGRRGKKWVAVVELGEQDCRQCATCRRRYWPDYRDDACKRCGGPLGEARPERRQAWLSFDTRKEADDAVAARRAAKRSGTYSGEPSRETFAAFLQAWLPKVGADLKRTTRANYRVNIEAYIVPRIGHVRLADLGAETLDEFYGELRARGGRRGGPLSAKTVRNVAGVVHKALATAVRWRKLPRNPADGCEAIPRPESRQDRQRRMRESVWSTSDLRRFLESVRDDRLYGAWLMVATTGMRRGELLGLRWSDVDLEAGRASIEQTLTLVDHVPTVSSAKTDAGARRIALDTETIAALREHRRHQSEERLAWGPAWEDTGLVFTRENGSLIHPERFLDWFRQRARAAGLSPIRLHDVRHAYATALLEAGVPMKVVSERLGHSSIGITMDLYSHVLEGLDREAAETGAAFILGT